MGLDWAAVHATTEIIVAVAALVASWSALSMRAAMSQLRLELAEARAKDNKEIRDYLNGSFMRSKEAMERMRSIEEKIEWLRSSVADLADSQS